MLQPHPRPGHQWPETLGRSHYGRGPAEPVAHTPFEPDTVVDPAVDGLRWRHPAKFVRLRPDLHPDDLIAATADGVQPDTSIMRAG